ncbi:MAG TPA: hypothetical protein VFU35_05480 [Jatrophihabitans sp.]|nr:hypothetical protein [Jatrophihabitans sp.]
MKVRWIGGTLVVALVVTACSTTTNGHPVAKPPSYLALTRIVLQPGDFPAGWQPRPTPHAGDEDVQAQIAACVGIRLRKSQVIDRAASPDYGSGEFTAASTAASFKTQVEVRNRLAAVLSPKADPCLATALRTSLVKVLPADTKIENLTVRAVKGGPAANVAATVHAVITITALGQTARVYSDTVFIGGVLFGAEIAFTGIGEPVPTDLQTRLTAAVVRRATRA